MTDTKVLVVDLDGTLYSINTFRYFLRFLVSNNIKKIQIGALFSLLFFMTLRVIGLISHSKMKYHILNSIKHKNIDFEYFVSTILKYKVEIQPVLDNSFATKILATAAPTCYAKIIANYEGFDTCLGTDFPKEKYNTTFENSKGNKKINLQQYLESNNLKNVNLFVTDHIDDAFCIKFAKQNLIVNPDKEFLYWLTNNNISFEVYKG